MGARNRVFVFCIAAAVVAPVLVAGRPAEEDGADRFLRALDDCKTLVVTTILDPGAGQTKKSSTVWTSDQTVIADFRASFKFEKPREVKAISYAGPEYYIVMRRKSGATEAFFFRAITELVWNGKSYEFEPALYKNPSLVKLGLPLLERD